MYEKISVLSGEIYERYHLLRREFHRFPETGWMEMRTGAIIYKVLKELGYEVLTGREVCLSDMRMGVPSAEELKAHADEVRNRLEAGDEKNLKKYITEDMARGYTGLIGILRCGDGPVAALRFDMDALPVTEAADTAHQPVRDGFASCEPGVMHACGHDAHMAMGLATAEILARMRESLHGTVKLIFQPAEEGVRGARSIVENGHLDDVDYFLGTHVVSDKEDDDGDITVGTYGALATTKFDVYFEGEAAHAGAAPEKGHNALLAAATAALHLAAIPRHGGGMSRINTGTLHAGSGRNVIPANAKMEIETRGQTTEINRYMEEAARQVCESSAAMYGCTCRIEKVGEADSYHSDEDFAKMLAKLLRENLPQVDVSSSLMVKTGWSEDISHMMNRVQGHGGKAVCMRFLTTMASPLHTPEFDLDERVIQNGSAVFAAAVCGLLSGEGSQRT